MSDEPTILPVVVEERTQYVTREVNITEKRAPTDESVKLLREMERAAQDQVDSRIRVTDNGFECMVECARDPMNMECVAVAIFTLNGVRKKAEARVPDCLPEPQRTRKLLDNLVDAVAVEIAKAVVRPAFLALQQNGMLARGT